MALIDFFLTSIGLKVNNLFGTHVDWSLKGLLGYLFYPFTFLIGVPLSDAFDIAKLIGERAVLIAVKAYQDLLHRRLYTSGQVSLLMLPLLMDI